MSKKDSASKADTPPPVPGLDVSVARDAQGKLSVFVTSTETVPDTVTVVVNGRHVWEGLL